MGVPRFLKIEEMRGVDLDSKEALIIHKRILRRKVFLKSVYNKLYNIIKRESEGTPKGLKVEIGSGRGFIKAIMPEVITTDLIEDDGIDKIADAEKLPFGKETISCIYVINVIHHLKAPENFFKECQRCLKAGGKVVMIETANTLFGRFVYKYFHHEGFDEKQKGWHPRHTAMLSRGNQANPWIIFVRDRKKFEKRFPRLRMRKMEPHTSITYLLSGGFAMKQLVPSFSYPLFSLIETAISPLDGIFGMFYTIVLEKV